MKEWDIVLILVVLIDLFLTIYNPMSKSTKDNTRAMTELTVTMKNVSEKLIQFEKDMDSFQVHNHNSHQRLWDKNEEQDKQINEHEQRIGKLEDKDK